MGKLVSILVLLTFWLNLALPCWANKLQDMPPLKQAQFLLKVMGYRVLVNGNRDRNTSDALKSIQSKFNLPKTGQLDGWTFFYLKYLVVTEKSGFTRDDIYLMAKTITAEAGGEPYTGQVAVGAVIVNRLQDPRFPKTIRAIIYAPRQFSVLNKLDTIKPTVLAYSAALDSLLGMDPSQGARYFYEPNLSTDKWIFTLPVINKIGHHNFAVN